MSRDTAKFTNYSTPASRSALSMSGNGGGVFPFFFFLVESLSTPLYAGLYAAGWYVHLRRNCVAPCGLPVCVAVVHVCI